MAAVRRGLEVVAHRPAERHEPEKVGPVHQVRPELEGGAPGIALPAQHRLRHEQPRDVERRIEPQLVGVELRRTAARTFVARLPFVRTVKRHRQHLAAPEQIVVADFEGDAGAEEAVRLGGDVRFKGRFERIVEAGVDSDIERVGAPQRIDRRDIQRDRPENAQLVQIGQRAVLSPDGEQLSAFERQRPGEQPGPDPHRPLRDDLRSPQTKRIGSAGFRVGQPDRHLAHTVGFERHGRRIGFEVQAQRDPARRKGRVSLVFEVLGPEIVIPPFAERLRHPPAFERQRIQIVLRPFAQQRSGAKAIEERLQRTARRRIGDPLVMPRRRHAETVAHPGLPPPLAVKQRIRGPGAEIAVVFERLLRDLRPQRRLHLRNQHRLLGQPLVEPVFETLLPRRVEVIVGPQSDRQRRPHIRAVKRIVRSYRKRLPGRRSGRRRDRNARVGFDADFSDARVEYLVRRQPPRRGAGGRKREGQRHGGRAEYRAVIHALRSHLVSPPSFSPSGSPGGTDRSAGAASCG